MNVWLVLEYLKEKPLTWLGLQSFSGKVEFTGDVDFNSANIDGLVVPDATYEHIESNYSDLWIVNHNLNKLYPNVVIVNEIGKVVDMYWESIDNNTLHIKPGISVKGKAYVS